MRLIAPIKAVLPMVQAMWKITLSVLMNKNYVEHRVNELHI